MKKVMLLAAMASSFLVVSVTLLGILLTVYVVLAMLVVTPFVAYAIIKRMRTPSTAAGTTTPTPPPQPKKYGWVWAVVVILVGLLTWWLTSNSYEKEKVAIARTQLSSVATAMAQYEWTWELPPGKFVRGLNKGGPMVAEIIPCSDGGLWVDTPYIEYGKQEKTRVRLSKTGEKSWEGVWEQENPADSGRCDLHQLSDGVWAGHMTGKAGIPAFCTLKRK